jgi:hypothetical protein
VEEAIYKASHGGLNPGEVYRQLPEPIQKEVDRLAVQSYAKTFGFLCRSEQCGVMGALAAEFKRMKEEAEKPISIVDALQLAAEGKIDDLKVYDALPEEMRKSIDVLAEALASSEFKKAKPEVRSKVLKIVLQALAQQAGGGVSDRGWELYNQAIEQNAKGDSAGAVKSMHEAEKALAEQASANGDPSAESVVVYCNLSSARAHLGDWTNDVELLRSAITAADRGLEQVAKNAERPEFNCGILLHNRGHAGWRLGELTRDRTTLSRARQDIAKAGDVFLTLKRAEAVKENNALSVRAETALARL